MNWRIHREPSDSTDSSSADKDPEAENIVSTAPSADPVAQLQAELEEYRDKYLRKAAEFENFRKRLDKEKSESMMMARSSVLLEFLPVADACERALESLENPSANQKGLQQYREGVELLYKQLLDTLIRVGVVAIQAEGREFDPHLHEAIAREQSMEHPENTVTQVLRRGYMFKDKLLRPAQVKVSVEPESESPEET
jgi:molecular chaperone GrpE